MTTKQLLCFQLRLEGSAYEEIARQSGYSVFSLRKYFSKQGIWYKEYEKWSEEGLAEATKIIQRTLSRQAYKAIEVLIKLLNDADKNPALAFKVAQDILDRTGVNKKVQEPIRTEDIAERIVRLYEEQSEG